MAEGSIFPGDGIVVLAAAETLTQDHLAVRHIVLTGTDAAAAFVFVIGNVTITVSTTAEQLTLTIPIGRNVNYLKLTSGPTAATLYAFLEEKSA